MRSRSVGRSGKRGERQPDRPRRRRRDRERRMRRRAATACRSAARPIGRAASAKSAGTRCAASSACAGRSIRRRISPGASTFVFAPVTKSMIGICRSPPSRDQIVPTPSSALVERNHRAGRQRHADVAADGRGVPDLERGDERAAALADQRRRGPFDRQRLPPQARRSCRSRRCASPRSSISIAGQPRLARSISRLRCGCGSENSQVPPAKPGVAVLPARQGVAGRAAGQLR